MVKIIRNDPWKNIENHQEMIKRCFLSLYFARKNTKEKNDVYHEMLLNLAKRNVFDRYNKNLPSKTRSSEKSFENYIFNAIKFILHSLYTKQHIEKEVILYVETIDEISPMTQQNEFYDPKEKDASKRAWREKRIDPSLFIPEYQEKNPQDDLEYEDTIKTLHEVCSSNIEQKIIYYKKQGLSNKDIGKILHKHSRTIETKCREIKRKFKKLYDKKVYC